MLCNNNNNSIKNYNEYKLIKSKYELKNTLLIVITAKLTIASFTKKLTIKILRIFASTYLKITETDN